MEGNIVEDARFICTMREHSVRAAVWP